MAVNYSPALTTSKDQVRFLIQDTDTSSAKFQDEEIDWAIEHAANIYMAAADLCDILVARSGAVNRKRIGNLSVSYDPKFYQRLTGSLRARGAGHQVPYAGGISVTDKDQQQTNADWVNPKFDRGLQDNPTAPQPEVPRNNPLTRV